MPSVPTSELVALQANTQNIRNLCVLAHVDHGKTTLSDALISSNGIISDKLAGKIRYMDNRKDEQLREITMKSSAISLLYRNAKEEPFLINLIDSPGHVDFSGEVSSAVRLCDGGFLVVDAVEGVCVQTDTVMRQAWKEKLKPVLVINKIDRLFMELQMGPDEAAEHLKKLLAVVNVSVATLMLEQQYEKGNQKNSDNAKAAATEEAFQRSQRPKGPPVSSSSSSSEGVTSFTVSLEGDSSWKLEEVNDDDIYFSPELGNVLFCSAIDGWGFRTTQFAEFYSKKMGFSKGALEKALWGEHYFDPKTKKVFGNSRGGKLKQMFTELVMRPLHQLYDSTVGSRDETKLKKICSVLGLSLTDRILGQLQTDPRYILTQVARQWIPLSPALIEMAIEHLPSPVDGQKSRADTLFRPLPSTISQEYRDEYERVKESVAKCESHADLQANPESSEAPVVIYISKMFTAPLGYGSSVQDSGPRIAMPKARKPIFTAAPHSSASPAPAAAVTPAPAPANPLSGSGSGSGEGSSLSSSGSSSASSESEETEKHLQGLRSKVMTGERFVGFARIFSGTVKIGQMLHVYGPKYDPLFPDKHHALVQCEELYLLMGRGLEPLREVPAGNVFGISGSQLPRHILKTGSLSTSACCPIFSDMVFSKPIMRVAVEPLVPAEMPILIEGLKLLNQADASVEIMVQESGEHVIVASGEVHLERCVTDLKEMFAPIELKFSSPIVGFREGLIQDPTRTGGIVIQPKDYLYAQMNLETIQSKDLLKEAKRGQIAFKKSLAQAMTRNKACVVTVRAIPLPDCIRDALELLGPQIKQVFIDHPNKSGAAFHSLQQKLLKSFIEAGNQWSSEFDKIWSIGPKRMGPNILFNHIGQICNSPFWKSLCSTEEAIRITLSSEDQGDVEKKKEEKPERAEGEEEEKEEEDPEAGLTEEEKWTISKIQEFEPSIVSAFQLTTQSGPLCEEPMMGVAFFIESLTIKNLPAEKMDDGGPIKGQVMSAVKEAGRQAFSKLPNRLIEPYYDCQLQVSTEQYGNACSVLSRRRAKIVGEELKEGTNIFILNAKLPVVSSFGLALEMMKKTSGAANAQLKFSHWELLDLDPDFVPTTAEELEEHGTNTGGIAPNLAKQLINDVRKRKGLYVDEQLVEHADKQRTLSKNK